MTKAFIEILLQAIVAAAGTSALIVYLLQKRSVRRNAAFLIVEQIDNLKHDIADISTYASKTKPSMGGVLRVNPLIRERPMAKQFASFHFLT